MPSDRQRLHRNLKSVASGDEEESRAIDPSSLLAYSEKLRQLETTLEIDRLALDDCISHQPSLYYEVADAVAIVAAKRDQAKHALAVLEAETAQRLRDRDTGIKVTEAGVKEETQIDREVKAAKHGLGKWQQLAQEFEALKDSFDQRGRMLQSLASLYVAGYFQSASAGSAGRRHSDAAAEENRRRIADRRSEMDRNRRS